MDKLFLLDPTCLMTQKTAAAKKITSDRGEDYAYGTQKSLKGDAWKSENAMGERESDAFSRPRL